MKWEFMGGLPDAVRTHLITSEAKETILLQNHLQFH